MIPQAETAARAAQAAAREGRKAGPIVLLGLAVLVLLVLLGWERFHGEAKADKMLDRWTGAQQAAYAIEVEARFKKAEAETASLKEAVASIRATLAAMQGEQGRQGSQLDRLVERLLPR